MNPFGQELRKILTQCKTSGVVSYAGRSAYIQLDPDLRARLEFVSLNIASQYNALKLTILNRTEGAVDVNILRFGDLLGKKKVSNPNFSDGILPHLWDDYGKVSRRPCGCSRCIRHNTRYTIAPRHGRRQKQ